MQNSIFKIASSGNSGTCFCIGKDEYLTCAHILHGPSWLELEIGEKIPVSIVHENKKYDFAKIQTVANVSTAQTIVNQLGHNFRIGEKLWIAGYPADMDDLTFMPVTVAAITKVRDATAIRLYGAIISGFSGAPVFTEEGKLVAMVTDKAANFTPSFQGFISAQNILNLFQPLLGEIVKNIKESSNIGFGYALPIAEIGNKAGLVFANFLATERIQTVANGFFEENDKQR